MKITIFYSTYVGSPEKREDGVRWLGWDGVIHVKWERSGIIESLQDIFDK
jgi:hypothetical protein